MRFTKVKDGAHIGRVGKHNFRAGKPGEGVDEARSYQNIYIGAQSSKDLHAGVKAAIATGTRKPRPDATKMLEFFCGASPEFFEGKTHEESKTYLDDCLEWARQTFGSENVIGAQYHFDEKTPHIHIEIVPMANTIKKTKHKETQERTLNSAHWCDGKQKMEGLQTSFAKFVQERGHALERGEPKSERLAMGGNVKHKPVRQWHAERIAEAKEVNLAAEELLADAATEAKKAAEARRAAERLKDKTEYERGLHAIHTLAIELRQRRKGRNFVETIKRKTEEAEARNAALDKREAELDRLTGGLASPPAHQKIEVWQGPSDAEARMLDFLSKNPAIADLLKSAAGSQSMRDVLIEISEDIKNPGMRAIDEVSPESIEARMNDYGQPRAKTNYSQGFGYG